MADLHNFATLAIDPKPVDRLAEMPDEILSLILSFLSVRDSAKARILSRRWRHISPAMSYLDFDLYTVLGMYYEPSYSNRSSSISWANRSSFITGVNKFLELYKGKKLDTLRICCSLCNDEAGSVDRWIRFAVMMKTEKLDLDFSGKPYCQRNNLYDFPFHLLPQGDSAELKYLCLSSCYLRPTPNLLNWLVPLKTLDLEDVPMTSANIILSRCSNLEWLRLKYCVLPETLSIRGPSPNLEVFIVNECYGVETIEISSQGLTTFEYIGAVKTFSFLEVPRLEKVHISFLVANERGTHYMFSGIANDLPRLQNLSLVLTTDEVLPMPPRISMFNFLRRLDLFVFVSSDFDLLTLTPLVNAAPLLQKLQLSLEEWKYKGKRRKQQYIRQVHHELKEIEIYGFLGKPNQMELAIYLLRNAIWLDRMTLSNEKRLYQGGGEWASSRRPWLQWQEKKAFVYDLLRRHQANSLTQLLVL